MKILASTTRKMGMRKSLLHEISYSRLKLIQASLLLFCISILLNLSAMEGFWRWDDPAFLTHITGYAIWQDFFNPAAWQDISPSNFTPWLTLSYKIDLVLFGLQPHLFYLHQIIAIGASAVVLNALLALWLPPVYAISSSLLFIIGTPALLVAQQLMTRHYVEGLFFCLTSFFFFIVHLRHKSRTWQLISAGFYLLATLSKEVFFPLFLILLFFPEKNIRVRSRSLIPHVLIALVYIFWRARMLGSLSGGYSDNSDFFSQIDLIEVLLSFSNFPNLLFSESWIFVTVAYLYFISIFIYRSPSSLVFLIIILFSIFAPLAPLVKFPGISIADRYLLLPWLVFSASCGVFVYSDLSKLKTYQSSLLRGPAVIAILAIAGSSALSSIQTRRVVGATAEQFDIVARYIWGQDASTGYLPSKLISSSLWYVTDLGILRQRVKPDQPAPLVIVDPAFLAPEYVNPRITLVEYNEICRCMKPSKIHINTLLEEWRQRERVDAPLTLSHTYQNNIFAWSFGPYEDGTYHIISDTLGITEVPKTGSQRVRLDLNSNFILRYTSPAGWTAHSTIETIVESAEEKVWRRPSL